MKIPITKPYIGEEEKRAIAQVIDSGWVSQGERVAEFEDKFAAYSGSKYAIAFSSCTAALHSALVVSGIGQKDEVIVPSLSFIATANAVVHSGAAPVFVDIDSKTCNIDPEKIERAITKKTKAIMSVHQMGLPADMDSIKRIADKHGLIIIEDAACAVGSEYKGKRIGSHGNSACFSFHPRKIITTGEGGMVTTDNYELSEKLKRFRHHSMSISPIDRHLARKVVIEVYPEVGYNYRLTDMQAAMGIVQLGKLPFIIEARRKIAEFYNKEFSSISCIKVPKIPGYAYHNYQSYWIELLAGISLSRDLLMERLLEKGIATRRGIMAIHMEEAYAGRGGKSKLPATENATKSMFLLPIYPTMTEDEQSYVVESIKEILR